MIRKSIVKNISPCPVAPITAQALRSTVELSKALKRLRRGLKKCAVCTRGRDCTVLADFNQKFDTALQQITDEWNLL